MGAKTYKIKIFGGTFMWSKSIKTYFRGWLWVEAEVEFEMKK